MAGVSVSELVQQVPDLDRDGKFTGPKPPVMENVFEGCLAAGPNGVRSVIDMLKEVDNGADYRARYVLHGLAVHVAAPERTAQRAMLCDVLAAECAGGRPKPIRGFLARQLQVCGTDAALESLSRLLGDPELCEYAAQAMLAIGGGAEAHFRDALTRVPADSRRTVVHALAVLDDPKAVPALRHAAADADVEIRLLALVGLARLGDRASVDLLLKGADSRGYERIQAAKACLVMAEKLVAAGHTDDALRIYRYLHETRVEPHERYIRDLAQQGMLAAGLKDPSPPTMPGGLKATATGTHALALAWQPSKDPDSGIWQYAVYRDDKQIAVVGPGAGGNLELVDDSVSDGKTYSYAVRAVNFGKTESAPAQIRTQFFDTIAPGLVAAACYASRPNQVRVTFSKPMAPTVAGDAASYTVSGGTRVTAATLSEDGMTVALKTAAALPQGKTFNVTVKGLTDRSVKRNALPTSEAEFTVLDRLPGIRYACFEEVLGDDLEPYNKAEPKKRGITPKIDVSVKTRDDNFSLRFDGVIEIPVDGEYTFYTKSDDGSRLYVDDALVVKNDGPHGPEEQAGAVRLHAGGHRITVTFFEQGGGEEVSAAWEGPDLPKQEIPPEALFHLGE